MKKGFGIKPQPKVKYQSYRVELKRRFAGTDSSELLIGIATIRVPKTFHDPTGETDRKRTVWDCFATGTCQHLLTLQAIRQKGVNALWLFSGNAALGDKPIERIETNPWQESGMPCIDQGVINEHTANTAWEAFQRCQVEVQWLDVPMVA